MVTPGGPITGSSTLPSLVGTQGQCWDAFPEGKTSTLLLQLLVCYLVIGNVCFFSSFPPNWQQASSAFPPHPVSPEPGSCCGRGAALEGFVLPSFQGDAGPCGVSWEHALTHLPTLAQQLGTHHSHWVCPVHLWACPLIFPNTVGFPWVLGLPLTPPCPPFLCTFPERHPAMFCPWFQCDLPTSEDTVQTSPVMRRLPYSGVSFLPWVYLEVSVPPGQTFSSCTTGSPRPTQMSPTDRLQVISEDSLGHCFTDESFSLWLLNTPICKPHARLASRKLAYCSRLWVPRNRPLLLTWGHGQMWFKFGLCWLEWPRTRCGTSLSLTFLMCNRKIIIPSSGAVVRIKWGQSIRTPERLNQRPFSFFPCRVLRAHICLFRQGPRDISLYF